MDYKMYTQFRADPLRVKKELPKLVDYTAPGFERFDAYLTTQNKFIKDNCFTEQVDRPITFGVELPADLSSRNWFVRCAVFDPKSPEKSIICKCKPTSGHCLYSTEQNARLEGRVDGIYPDERLSILLPLQNQFSLQFRCNNSCFLDRDRKFAGLVIILEDEYGNMFARRHFKFGIVARPCRSSLNYDTDEDGEAGNHKRKRSAKSDDDCHSPKMSKP